MNRWTTINHQYPSINMPFCCEIVDFQSRRPRQDPNAEAFTDGFMRSQSPIASLHHGCNMINMTCGSFLAINDFFVDMGCNMLSMGCNMGYRMLVYSFESEFRGSGNHRSTALLWGNPNDLTHLCILTCGSRFVQHCKIH